jgi:putative transcriptional regulator
MARGEGPHSALLALGYASWAPGQLEREIVENTWLHGPASADLIFQPDHDTKYDRALAALGIDKAFLSQEAGHG